MDSNPGKTSTENIDEVILRLLKLKTGIELDYQTYAKKIKIKLASSRMVGAFIPAEEDILLREEFKRVRNKEGRFVILKSKKTKVSSPPPPSGSDGGGETPPKTSAIVKAPPSGKITIEKLFNTPRVEPVNVRDITPDRPSQVDPLTRISDLLDSILETLTNINNFDREQANRGRRDAENKRRDKRETDLESKPFEGIKKAVSAITKPFQSIWDRIINFITNVIFGRIIIKLLDWLANPKNQEKSKTIIRFLGDWWPALLGSYVLFGTTFGKFIRGAIGMVGRFIFHIGKVAIPQLLKFIKTPIGAGIALFTAGATIPAMFPGTVNEQERKTTKAPGSTEDKIKALQQQKANLNVFEKLQGKGSEIDEQISLLETGKTKSYGFSGGGFANFGNMFGGNPISTLLGSEGEEQKSNGFVSGQSGVDKVPAMLTDGEFVMSTGAVQKYGVDTLEAMNAAGGGTNKPKIMGGKTYAAGGGPIGGMANSGIDSIKKFIKHKIGYDVDKPETWGTSFSSVFANKSSKSTPPTSKGKGFDFISTAQGLVNQGAGLLKTGTDPRSYQGLVNQGAGLLKTGTDPRSYQGLANQAQGLAKSAFDPRSYQGLANQAQGLANQGLNFVNQKYKNINDPNFQKNLLNYGQKKLKDVKSSGSRMLGGIKDKVIGTFDSPLASLEKYGTNRENALIKSGELKPGAALTKTTQANLDKSDAWIKSLYDPKKDKGPMGSAKKVFQDVQNKGFVQDPFAMFGLKEEGTEKFVEKISGGKIKNFGAKITGLQYALKGLAGPLGKAFRIDDRGSLGRYAKPAMLEAQKKGQGGVGAVGLGQKKYDSLMNDKLANLALGQFNFKVDKKGRATTDDTYEGNKPASEYFKGARSALKKGDIGSALFKGVSGVLRINQNTGWGNLRPGGAGIDLGGGFQPTDASGKPLTPKQIEKQKTEETYGRGVKLYDKPQKNTKQPYKSKFTRPSNPITQVKPLPKPKPKPIVVGGGSGGRRGSGSRPSSGSNSPSFNAQHSKGTFVSSSAYGIMR